MRIALMLLLALTLAGCGSAPVYETVQDRDTVPVVAEARQIQVSLPQDTVLPVMEHDGASWYVCGDFDVVTQTLEGGDLEKTLSTVTGCDSSDLTVITTGTQGNYRHEFIWTAAGETGQQLCRGAVVDDGTYHYVLCAMAPAENAREYREMWNGMFESFYVEGY